MTIRFRFTPTRITSLAVNQWVKTDNDPESSGLQLEESARPDFVIASGNASSLVAGIVGVVGAALVFGAFAPHVPAQPGLQKTWEQRATQQYAFAGGRAVVFKPQPTSVVQAENTPLRPTLVAADQQRQFQPQSLVFKQQPAGAAAVTTPLVPTFVATDQQRRFQPQPVVANTPSLFAPAQPGLQKSWEQRATQQWAHVSGRAYVFKSPPFAPPAVEDTPLRPTRVVADQQRQYQPAPSVFGAPPASVAPPVVQPTHFVIVPEQPRELTYRAPILFTAPFEYVVVGFIEHPAAEEQKYDGRGYAVVFKQFPTAAAPAAEQPRGMVLAAPQANQRQLASVVFGTLPVVATPLRPAIVAPEAQRQYQPPARIFGTLPIPPAPLEPTIVVPEAQSQKQIAPILFGTLPLPSTPLRQAIVVNAEQSKVQPGPSVFGSPHLPSAIDTPLSSRHFLVPPQQDPTQRPALVFGSPLLPSAGDTPLTGRHFIVPQQSDPTQRAAFVFGSPLLPSAVDTPLAERHFVVPQQQDPTQRAALVLGQTPTTTPTAQPRQTLVATEQGTGRQSASQIFGTVPLPPTPLRAVLFASEQQSQTQPQPVVFSHQAASAPDQVVGVILRTTPQAQQYLSAQVYGSALLPSVGAAPPLRPIFIALAGHYREQPAAHVFGKQPEPAGAIDCTIETNNPPQTVSTTSPNAGDGGGVAPPFRTPVAPAIRVIMETNQVQSVRGKLSLTLPSQARTGTQRSARLMREAPVELPGGQAQSSELHAVMLITCRIDTEQNAMPMDVQATGGQVQSVRAVARMSIASRMTSAQSGSKTTANATTHDAPAVTKTIEDEIVPTYDGDEMPDMFKDV